MPAAGALSLHSDTNTESNLSGKPGLIEVRPRKMYSAVEVADFGVNPTTARTDPTIAIIRP